MPSHRRNDGAAIRWIVHPIPVEAGAKDQAAAEEAGAAGAVKL